MEHQQQLSKKDRHMVRLYLAGCFHNWDEMPDIAREFLAAGCSSEELRACVRHLVVFAGYGPCLAATFTLQKAKVLPENTPAKAGGPPGNAFELVYGDVTDVVRKKMHSADPGLGEWIRCHLYGDVYSSPGLDLRQKQLLACCFLGVARMPDQLFGHALAAFRFGNNQGAVEECVRLGFHMAPSAPDGVKQEALRMVDMAHAKYLKDYPDQHAPPPVSVPHPSSIRIPPLPPLYNAPGSGSTDELQDVTVTVTRGGGSSSKQRGGVEVGAGMDVVGEEASDDVVFAWEVLDPRCNKSTLA